MRRLVLGVLSVATLVAAGCGDASDPRPNVVLIVSADQRVDTVGVLGSRVAATPHIDRLAREGVLFENDSR